MAADTGVSVGVVVAGLLIAMTGLLWIDPVVSLAIVAVVLVSTWRLLRDSLHLAMQGTPRDIDADRVRSYLSALPEVESVHDLHIWAMSTTEVALSVHLVAPQGKNDEMLGQIVPELLRRFGIEHPTVQIERGGYRCRQAAPNSS
jgi:cobalt-zinc-cadmium efflux system protein